MCSEATSWTVQNDTLDAAWGLRRWCAAPGEQRAELREARMFKKKKNKKKKEDAGASVSEFGMDFSDEEDEGAGAPVAAIVQENVTFSGYLSYSGIKRGAPLRKGTPKE